MTTTFYKGEPLLYEEFVMLQDILIMLVDSEFVNNLDTAEREIFEDLYNKIMKA